MIEGLENFLISGIGMKFIKCNKNSEEGRYKIMNPKKKIKNYEVKNDN